MSHLWPIVCPQCVCISSSLRPMLCRIWPASDLPVLDLLLARCLPACGPHVICSHPVYFSPASSLHLICPYLVSARTWSVSHLHLACIWPASHLLTPVLLLARIWAASDLPALGLLLTRIWPAFELLTPGLLLTRIRPAHRLLRILGIHSVCSQRPSVLPYNLQDTGVCRQAHGRPEH